MKPELWRTIKEEIVIWHIDALAGIAVIELVMIAHLTSLIQFLEWLAFDNFFRLRPDEPRDEQIIIVGINEDDVSTHTDFSLSNHDLVQLLLKLQTYKPRVINLDIYRDLPVNLGHTKLVTVFQSFKNLIGIEKVLPDEIAPPPALSPEQAGFADQIIDSDGKLRRSLLGTPTSEGYK